MEEKACSAQIVAWTDPGVKVSAYQVLSVNSLYFAYCSSTSCVVRDIDTLEIVLIPTTSYVSPVTIDLCKSDPDLLAISFANSSITILSISNKYVLTTFRTEDPIFSLGWIYGTKKILCFSKGFTRSYTIDCESSTITPANAFYESMLCCAVSNESDPKIVGGNRFGTIQLFVNLKLKDKTNIDQEIVSIEFDPLNNENVLVATLNGGIFLYQITDKLTLINRVDTNYKISSASWLPMMPGHFITTDPNIGSIKIWSAGSQTPVFSFNITQAGAFQAISLKNQNIFAAFKDGMVCVYNIDKKKILFQATAPHSAMITRMFCMESNPDVLITNSCDSTFCYWDLNDFSLIDRFEITNYQVATSSSDLHPDGETIVAGGTDGAVYVISQKRRQVTAKIPCFSTGHIKHISVCRHKPSHVLCISTSGKVAIVDIVQKNTFSHHEQIKNVLCGGFSPHKPGLYAIATADGILMIFDDTGTVSIRLPEIHPTNLIFSPKNPDMLALTFDDGRVITVNIAAMTIIHQYIGVHSGACLNALFHPFFDDILITCGEDFAINVLSIKYENIVCKFNIHNSAIPTICVSPTHPLLLVTTCTDSTLRFLAINRIFVKKQIMHLFNSQDDIDDLIKWITPMRGVNQTIKLAHRIAKDKKVVFKKSEPQHINDLVRMSSKYAEKMLQSAEKVPLIKRVIMTRDKQIEAAKEELRSGNIRRYCELMMSAGETKKALAAAPAVSAEFWKDMVSQSLENFEPKEQIALSVAIGDIETAVENCDDYQDKMLLSVAGINGLIKKPEIAAVDNKMTEQTFKYMDLQFQNNDLYLAYSIASKKAKKLLKEGEVVMAGCCYLSIGDVGKACHLLVRHGAPLVAYFVDKIVGSKLEIVKNSISRLLMLSTGLRKLPDTYEEFVKSFSNYYNFDPLDVYQQNVQNFITASKQMMQEEEFDFCQLESLFKLIENVPVKYSNDDAPYIVFFSLILSFYKAYWRKYFVILPKIVEKATFFAQKIGQDWTEKCLNPCRNMLEIVRNFKSKTIESIGRKSHNSSNYTQLHSFVASGQPYICDKKVISYEFALMWAEVSPYQITSENTDFICL